MSQPNGPGRVGTFTITTGAPGAPVLRVFLVSEDNSSQVAGFGVYVQASTHPAVEFVSVFDGQTHVIGGIGTVPPKQFFALEGRSLSGRIGAPYVADLLITLDGIFTPNGTASYTVVRGAPPWEKIEAPVTVEWQE